MQWRDRVLEEYPALTIVGEEWSVDPAIVSRWQQGPPPDAQPAPPPPPRSWTSRYSTLSCGASTSPRAGRQGYCASTRRLPTISSTRTRRRLVVFADNHDMSRIYTQLGARLDRWKMAMAFFATVRGTPQFTWGSEILMANPGTDAHGIIRQDFPGRLARRRGGCGAGRGPSAGLPARRRTTCGACSHWRKSASAVHGGIAHAVRAGGRYLGVRPPGLAPGPDGRLQQE